MAIGPIFRSVLRNPAGAILIGLQLALTLAIVSNAVFIIQQRIDQIARDTGVVEAELLTASSFYYGKSVDKDAQADIDIQALMAIPGVKSVSYTNAVPLGGSNNTTDICYTIDDSEENCPADASVFRGGVELLDTFGLELVEGRRFTSSDLVEVKSMASVEASSMIVSQAVATAYFPNSSAVGQIVYVASKPVTIVGVVAELLRPANSAKGENGNFSVLFPQKLTSGYLAVRLESDRMAAVEEQLSRVLLNLNDQRVISAVRSMESVVARAYGKDTAMIYLLVSVIALLVLITALGISGLVSFTVASRKKQIGTRRALGATRSDILSYFMTENGMISLVAVVLGTVMAMILNQYLMQNYELSRLQPIYIIGTVLLLLGISQMATFLPALRAAKISPAIATRTV